MNTTINYKNCPCCHSSAIHTSLNCKDYTVSGEVFEVWECSSCTARFTQHIPDQQSVGRYYQSANYVSHSNTKKGFVNRLYHIVRNITLKSKLALIKQYTGKRQGEILDIGAGTGAFAHTMQQAGWAATALEPDEGARENAKVLYGLTLQALANLNTLPDNRFDAITLWHVLEHVHELHEYFAHFYRLLKPGGKLFIAVPNYTCYDANVYDKYWAAYDVPRHLYHFSPKSMGLLAEAKGFIVSKIQPMWYDSFYVSMLSEKYRQGKSNLVSALINGLRSNIKAVGNSGRCSSIVYVMGKRD